MCREMEGGGGQTIAQLGALSGVKLDIEAFPSTPRVGCPRDFFFLLLAAVDIFNGGG